MREIPSLNAFLKLGKTIEAHNTGSHSTNENFTLCSLKLEKGYTYLVHGYVSLVGTQGQVINVSIANKNCDITFGLARGTGLSGGGTPIIKIASNVKDNATISLVTYCYDVGTMYEGHLCATKIGIAQ